MIADCVICALCCRRVRLDEWYYMHGTINLTHERIHKKIVIKWYASLLIVPYYKMKKK